MNWLIEHSDKVVEWIWLLVAVAGLVNVLRQKDRSDKWKLIRESLPEIHDLVQKIAKATPTKKDDEFVRQIGKVLEAAGFKLLPEDVGAVKALASGFHQAAKIEDRIAEAMSRDPLADDSE
jgi:hypothetical protein